MTAVLISSVEGNRQWLDGGAMFGNVPRAVWAGWLPPDERGRIELACRSMLVEIDGLKILAETGIGAFFDTKHAERFGVFEREHKLLSNLIALGHKQEEITHVILSHLHFDHAGGLLPTWAEINAGNDSLLFPNAKYVVGEEAFARAMRPHPRDRASFISNLQDKLRKSGRLIVIPKGQVQSGIHESVTFAYSDGHTPGQMHTKVKGKDRSIWFCGDLVPGRAWVHLPVTMGYDRFAELVIDEKSRMYQEVAQKDWISFFTHDHRVAAATLLFDGTGKIFVAEEFQKFERFSL